MIRFCPHHPTVKQPHILDKESNEMNIYKKKKILHIKKIRKINPFPDFHFQLFLYFTKSNQENWRYLETETTRKKKAPKKKHAFKAFTSWSKSTKTKFHQRNKSHILDLNYLIFSCYSHYNNLLCLPSLELSFKPS